MTQTQTQTTVQHPPRIRGQAPSADSTAAHMVRDALASCTNKMGSKDISHTAVKLRRGDSTACSYFLYSLARQVAEALGVQDDNIQAVYLFEHDATPQDSCFADPSGPAHLLHLIVHVSRQTAALNALIATLDRALVQATAQALDSQPQQSLLDVHVIDDAVVTSRTGYGALLHSLHNRPIQVWTR